jgi:hypothetical protein
MFVFFNGFRGQKHLTRYCHVSRFHSRGKMFCVVLAVDTNENDTVCILSDENQASGITFESRALSNIRILA